MKDTVTIERKALKAIRQALLDATREIEGMEESHEWYTASPKLMDRLEKAVDATNEVLK